MTFHFPRAFGAVICGLLVAACYSSRPIVDPSAKPPTQEGTVSGHVTTDSDAPVAGRIVRAVPLEQGVATYETTTNSTGAYTMKVRPGRYRLEVELRSGERLAKQPGETTINPSDLDPDQDFVVTLAR
jgi:hypothetical protein